MAEYDRINELFAGVKVAAETVPIEEWSPPSRSPRSLNRTRYYRLKERSQAENLRRVIGE